MCRSDFKVGDRGNVGRLYKQGRGTVSEPGGYQAHGVTFVRVKLDEGHTDGRLPSALQRVAPKVGDTVRIVATCSDGSGPKVGSTATVCDITDYGPYTIRVEYQKSTHHTGTCPMKPSEVAVVALPALTPSPTFGASVRRAGAALKRLEAGRLAFENRKLAETQAKNAQCRRQLEQEAATLDSEAALIEYRAKQPDVIDIEVKIPAQHIRTKVTRALLADAAIDLVPLIVEDTLNIAQERAKPAVDRQVRAALSPGVSIGPFTHMGD